MAAACSDGIPTLRAPVPFGPNPFQLKQMPLFEQNLVPIYLIRVYAPNSAGQTTGSYVIPPASNRGKVDLMQDLFALPEQNAATCLDKHVRWDPNHEKECNLTSWTSSLLFALQYGLYKHRVRGFIGPDLSTISLLLLDTRGLPKGTFVKDLEIMETFMYTVTP